MRTNLNNLSEDWKTIEQVVLYGAGINAAVIYDVFNRMNIRIKYVLDRDPKKQNTFWNNVPIRSYTDVKDEIMGVKIIIMTAHTAYIEISRYLEQFGLKENIDFCGLGQFVCEWFWRSKEMNCIYHVDMTVTTRCTFNCKHCNMFIPYYDQTADYRFETLKKNIDLLFERIDYVAYLGLIGGETLLCEDLEQTIDYISTQYRDKYGRISFTTNGSVIPSDSVLECLKRNNVLLTISDYTKFIPYKDRFDQLLDTLNKKHVSYEIKYALEWVDFGFPISPVVRTDEQLREHLKYCHPEWNGLNDGKFYYCNVSWSAEKSGQFKLQESDYIVLEDVDPMDKEACHKIVELSRGTSSFCRVCGGCGRDNEKYVPVGEQLER